MGRRWLFTSRIGFCFWIGEILANFHDDGSRASKKERFNIFDTGAANMSALSFKSQLGIPSGPVALVGFNVDSLISC